MSNINKNQDVEDMTSDFREDDLKNIVQEAPKINSFVKVAAPDPNYVAPVEKQYTAEEVVLMQRTIQEEVRKQIHAAKFDSNMPAQVIPKGSAPVIDFSKLTMDDIYDLNVSIPAKEFMSADELLIKLKDTNYEARWVNKNPQRIGDLMGKGFTYIEAKDLVAEDEAIKAALDAQGHYSINDVVAMKIDKATYYAALRHAHLRAISLTDSANLVKKITNTSNSYMQKSEASRDYLEAERNKKMVFYDPGIGV